MCRLFYEKVSHLQKAKDSALTSWSFVESQRTFHELLPSGALAIIYTNPIFGSADSQLPPPPVNVMPSGQLTIRLTWRFAVILFLTILTSSAADFIIIKTEKKQEMIYCLVIEVEVDLQYKAEDQIFRIE